MKKLSLEIDSKTVQRSALCRSRRELSNEYLLAKIGVDTAENEPLEVSGKLIQYYSFVSLARSQLMCNKPPPPQRKTIRVRKRQMGLG